MTADQASKNQMRPEQDHNIQMYPEISKIYEEEFHCIMQHQDIADREQRKQRISLCYTVATQKIDDLFSSMLTSPNGRVIPIDPRLREYLNNIHEKAVQCMLNAQDIPTIKERKKELESCHAKAIQKIHNAVRDQSLDSAELTNPIDSRQTSSGRAMPIDGQTLTDPIDDQSQTDAKSSDTAKDT